MRAAMVTGTSGHVELYSDPHANPGANRDSESADDMVINTQIEKHIIALHSTVDAQ